MNFLDVKRYQ